MANLALVVKELQQERSRLDEAIAALTKLLGGNHARTFQSGARRPRRTMSPAGRRKIAAAQRARWAKWKAKHMKLAA